MSFLYGSSLLRVCYWSQRGLTAHAGSQENFLQPEGLITSVPWGPPFPLSLPAYMKKAIRDWRLTWGSCMRRSAFPLHFSSSSRNVFFNNRSGGQKLGTQALATAFLTGSFSEPLPPCCMISEEPPLGDETETFVLSSKGLHSHRPFNPNHLFNGPSSTHSCFRNELVWIWWGTQVNP